MNSQTEIFVEEFETFYVAVWREKEEVGEEGLRGREDRWKEGSEEDVRLRGKGREHGRERRRERGKEEWSNVRSLSSQDLLCNVESLWFGRLDILSVMVE